jgi:probable F420-dependent oxidoreductase
VPLPELGLFLPSNETTASGPRALDFARLVEIARNAEAAGFHSLWFPDHYFIQTGPGQHRGGFEAWTLLSALAASTSRIKLGTLVLCNTFRHPAILAKQAVSLHEISNGRVILGLGAGWHEPEYKALGLPFDHRVSRLEENATAIRELFDKGTSSFQGRWLKLDDAELTPRPKTQVPFWIAASGERMLELTARLADGWNLAWFGESAKPFARKVEALKQAIEAAGRPAGAVQLSVGVQAQICEPGGEGATFDALRQAMPQFANAEPEQIKRGVLVGDAAAARTALEGYAEAGASLAIIGMPGLSALPADAAALDRLFSLSKSAAAA